MTTAIPCLVDPSCEHKDDWPGQLAHAASHPLPHPDDRAAWLAARRTFIGASEVPSVVGINPWRGALSVYAAKVSPPAADTLSTAARMGLLFEKPLLQDYADRRKVKLSRPSTQRLAGSPWVGATPDADCEDGTLVQVKLVGHRGVRDWEGGPPDYVKVQVQTEMAVFGRKRCIVLALLGGTDLQEFPIDFDPEVWGWCLEAVTRLWREHVVAQVIPIELEASRGSAADLQRLYPLAIRPLGVATPEERELAISFAEVREELKAIEQRKETLSEQLRALIGDREGFAWSKSADAPKGYATWKAPKGSAPWKAIAEACFDRYMTPGEAAELVEEFTPAVGDRRLLVNFARK